MATMDITNEPKPAEEPKQTEMDPKIFAHIKKRVVEGKCTHCGIKLSNIFITSTVKLKSDGSSLVDVHPMPSLLNILFLS